MNYPGSYELPLRTMYNLNCTARAQATRCPGSHPVSTASTPDLPQDGFPDVERVPTFSENLMAQINSASNQPLSLPPAFIVQFVQRCFPVQLHAVDFPQTLTGLDYLKDLETRRRRELHAAMDRMGIDADALHRDSDDLSATYPGVMNWLESIEAREVIVERLYTQLYVGIRRWILLNELHLLPFNKHNCVAMLNTLYPPALATQPTSQLTRQVLKNQRDMYFKYITCVERSGTCVLRNLILQGKAEGDDNAWPSIVRLMEHYLQVATSMINECLEINDIADIAPPQRPAKEQGQSRRKGKADSGISFTTSDRRPSTRGSSFTSAADLSNSDNESIRPKTPGFSRSGTALEKLARGLMAIGRGRTDATEMVNEDGEVVTPPPPTTPSAERPSRMLRKMRSLGSFEGRSRQPSDTPAFDADAMRKQRMRFEAGLSGGKGQSQEI